MAKYHSVMVNTTVGPLTFRKGPSEWNVNKSHYTVHRLVDGKQSTVCNIFEVLGVWYAMPSPLADDAPHGKGASPQEAWANFAKYLV